MPEDTNQFNLRDNKYGNESPFFMLAVLIMTIFISLFLGMLVSEGYSAIKGLDFQETFNNLSPESTPEIRNFVRVQLIINHLTTFILPAFIFAYFFYQKKWANFLHLRIPPQKWRLILGGLLIIVAFPLAEFFYWLNLQIPLPGFMLEMEQSIADTVNNLLIVDQPYELLFNLFVIAVIPALGEEFIFRGIIQKKLSDHLVNPHIAIWVAAFIFSAIHFQFQGLLTRMFLGGILGYLYYWTGNLWVPIFAHFLNNAFQIIGQYLYQIGLFKINMEEPVTEVNWGLTIISIVAVFALSKVMIRIKKRRDQISEIENNQNDPIIEGIS